MVKKKHTERTSENVATIAGRLLNGTSLNEATSWLMSLTLVDSTADDRDRAHALVLLGALSSMRTLAASALSQR